MRNEQIICDASKIILEDGKTLLPGYVEIKNGMILQHYSDDPANKGKLWELHNRIEYRRVEERGKAPSDLEGMHFLDMDTMGKWAELVRYKNKILDKK